MGDGFRFTTKDYISKAQADADSLEMKKKGYMWFSGWYTTTGYSIEYRISNKRNETK